MTFKWKREYLCVWLKQKTLCRALCGPWSRKHNVNVQKAAFLQPPPLILTDFLEIIPSAAFLLAFFFNSTSCFTPPIEIKFKSSKLLLFLHPQRCPASHALSSYLTLKLLVLVSFSSSLTLESDRLTAAYVEAKVRSSSLQAVVCG